MEAAFSELLTACDGVSCSGTCKTLFDASYRTCMRGYQPFVVVDGMSNASVRAIVETCMPPLCSINGGGDGCSERIRNVPAVVQVYLPHQDGTTSRYLVAAMPPNFCCLLLLCASDCELCSVCFRDYRLTWAAVLLAFEVMEADRSLFRGWNVSWTLRCATELQSLPCFCFHEPLCRMDWPKHSCVSEGCTAKALLHVEQVLGRRRDERRPIHI
jgi:hypothetical protein